MNSGFVAGVQDLVRGLAMITEPGLRRYAVLPLILSVLAFVVLLALSIHFFGDFTGWVAGLLPQWLAWAVWLLWIGFAALFVFGFYFGFTLMIGLVGLPFFMTLANAVERRLTGRVPEVRHGMLYLIAVGTVRQVPRLGYLFGWLLAVLLVSVVLGFIPLINALTAPIWFLFGAWAFAVMMSDFPLGARNYTWRHQHRLIRQNGARVLGFGVACSFMTLVPVLNLFLLPAATAGITALWVETLRPS